MAVVTVTFTDVHKDGNSQVGCSIKVEHDKGDDPAGPATNSMITALCVQRLFSGRVLMSLTPMVCMDALQQRSMLMQAIADAAAQGAAPPPDGLPAGPSEAIPGAGTAAGGSPPPLSAA